MAYKFGVGDVLAAMGLSGASAVQEYSNAQNIEFASVQNNAGNTIQGTETPFNNRYESTITVKADGTDTTSSFKLGGIGVGGVVITSAAVRYTNNDYPTLSVTAHRHTTADSHIASVASGDGQNEWSIADVPLTFGIPKAYLLGSGLALEDCQSCELAFSCEHSDKLNNVGMFRVGNSFDARCECSEEYVSDSGGTAIADTDWKGVEFATRQVNKDFYLYSVKAFRHDVEDVI